MLLNGFSAGLVFMPVTSTMLRGVEPEHAGSASGLLQTAQQLGGAIGLAVIASVYAAGAVPGQFMPGLTGAFLASATMAVVALLLAVVVLRPTRQPCVELTPIPIVRDVSVATRRAEQRKRLGLPILGALNYISVIHG